MSKQTQIALKYSDPKAKALGYYLEKQGKSIEKELQDYLEQMYKEQVPDAVREYVQSQNPDEETKEEKQDGRQTKRQSQRHKNDQTSADASELTSNSHDSAPSGPTLSM